MARKNRLKKRKFKAAQIYSVSDNLDNVVSVAPMMKASRQTESQLLSVQRQETSSQIDSMIAAHNQARDSEAAARSELSSAALGAAARDAVANIAAARDAATASVAIAAALGSLVVRETGEQLAANAKAATDKGVEAAKSAVAAEAAKTGSLADAAAKTAAAEAAEQQAALDKQTAQLAATAATVATLNNTANAVAAAAVTALSAAQVAAGNAAMAAFASAAQGLLAAINSLNNIKWVDIGLPEPHKVCLYVCDKDFIIKPDGKCHEDTPNKMFGKHLDNTNPAKPIFIDVSTANKNTNMCQNTVLDTGAEDATAKSFFYFKDVPIFFVHWLNNFTLGSNGLNGHHTISVVWGLNQAYPGAQKLLACLEGSAKLRYAPPLNADNDKIDVRIYATSAYPNIGKVFWYGLKDADVLPASKISSGESTAVQTALIDFLTDYIKLFISYLENNVPSSNQGRAEKDEVQHAILNDQPYWTGPIKQFTPTSTTVRLVPK